MNKSTIEFLHDFKGFGRVPSKCRVLIEANNLNYYICFQDLGNGTSVTNASEQLATEIVDKMDFEPDDCRFFETYSQYNNDTFDEITYEWDLRLGKWEAKKPNWTPISKEEMEKMFNNKI